MKPERKPLCVLAGESYQAISDGYGVVGDAIYKQSNIGWWDYTASNLERGGLPETLEDFLRHVKARDGVEPIFKEFPINLIVCECYGAHGAEPMIRFYQEISTIVEDEDSTSGEEIESEEIDIGFHGFFIERNEKDLLTSRLVYRSEASLFPLNHFDEMDEEHKWTKYN